MHHHHRTPIQVAPPAVAAPPPPPPEASDAYDPPSVAPPPIQAAPLMMQPAPLPIAAAPKPSSGLAKGGQTLEQIFRDHQNGTFDPRAWSFLRIDGDKVGVDVRSEDPHFDELVAALRARGMEIDATSPYHGIVEGMLPIGELENVADLKETSSLSPIFSPMLHTLGQ